MFTEELNTIREAEENAETCLKEAKTEATRIVEEANSEARKLIEKADAQAKDQMLKLQKEGEAAAEQSYRDALAKAQTEAASLAQAAEAKKNEAISMIAERIAKISVNS